MSMLVKSVFFVICLALLGTHGYALDAASLARHPIEKVIATLKELKSEVAMEGQEEAVVYQKFTLWCSTTISTLKDATSDEKEQISELTDLKDGKIKENSTLTEERKSLGEELKNMASAHDKAEKMRLNETKHYDDKMGDLKDTIIAVSDAMHTMTKAHKQTEKVSMVQGHLKKVISLVSLRSVTVAEEQMKKLQAFADPKAPEKTAEKLRKERAANRPDQLAKGDRSAHVDTYDFKSENVIELLKDLKAKFEADKLATVKGETNSQNEFDLAKLARDNAMTAARESGKRKKTMQSSVMDTIAETVESLDNLKEDLEVDSKNLKDTKQQCGTKQREWEERSSTRTNEMDSIDAAVRILAEATGVRTKAPENAGFPASPVEASSYEVHGFLQIDQVVSTDDPKMSVVALIRNAAQATQSRALERLAVEIKAHLAGPFDQLNNMIEKMIFRLMDEQRQEDEHKDWCDQELSKSNTLQEKQEDKADRLDKDHAKEKGKVGLLAENLKSASQKLSDIVTFMADATEIRETGKKENKLAIKDAEHAQQALENAIAVLTSFYKDSGAIQKEPWEFVQESETPRQVGTKLPENPNTWGPSYTGATENRDPSTGIISVLEAVMAKFSKMEAETKSQEVTDQEKFEQVIFDSKEEKARLTTESNMQTSEQKRRVEKMASLMKRSESTKAEMESTKDYLKKLEPACVSGDSSYKKRKGARTEEITALKKAKVVLADAFTKQKKTALFLEVHRHA